MTDFNSTCSTSPIIMKFFQQVALWKEVNWLSFKTTSSLLTGCSLRWDVDSDDTAPAANTPNPVAPALWRDTGETIYSPKEQAAYKPNPEYWGASNNVADSTAPSHADPLTRHSLSYLNGDGSSGKTRRAIELFRGRNPLVFTPTHRLTKEMNEVQRR